MSARETIDVEDVQGEYEKNRSDSWVVPPMAGLG